MAVKWNDHDKRFGHVRDGIYKGRLVRLDYDDNKRNVASGPDVSIMILMNDGWTRVERLRQQQDEKKGENKEALLMRACNLADDLFG